MKDNVISLGDIKYRTLTVRQAHCDHMSTVVDPVGRIVTCTDCEKQLDPLWILERALDGISEAREGIERSQKVLREEWAEFNKKHRYLKVVKEIERAWRGQNKMAVCCPHCHAGILPEDGLGDHKINPKIELKRRREKLK